MVFISRSAGLAACAFFLFKEVFVSGLRKNWTG
jgi:hypothetical protein